MLYISVKERKNVMVIGNRFKRFLAMILCLFTLCGACVPTATAEDDFLFQLFLLALMEEYGLYDISDLLDLIDADSMEELYDLYDLYGGGGSWDDSSFSGSGGADDAAYYDDEGYAIYLDDRSGFYYGLYDDDTAYIIGHQGLGYGGSINLTIPANVEGYPVYDIFDYAFENAAGIGSVTLEEGIQRIGVGAFMGSDIKSIVLPGSLAYVEYDAFSGCSVLEQVIFSEGLEYIGACAFMDCISLREAILPDSLTTIDFDAFSGCSSMKQARLGAGLTSMTGNVFSFCPSLNSLQISAGNRCFTNNAGLLINTFTGTLLRYDASVRSETAFAVPDGIKVIGEMCFENAPSLTSIVLSQNVKVLESYSLWGCTGLTMIDLGSVETIEYNAVNVNSMREVVLPDTIISMDAQAFCLRSDAYDIGGSRMAYAVPDTVSYSSARSNGFVVRPMSMYTASLLTQPEEPVPDTPTLHITPDYLYEGEWTTIEFSCAGATGEVQFNMQGTLLGTAPIRQGKASISYQANKSGVFTITALIGMESVAMERLIVTTPDVTPVVQQLRLPCIHEAGHTMCEPVINITYKDSRYETAHYLHTLKSEAWVCNRCGMYMIDDPASSVYTLETHVFVNQRCVCGMVESAENNAAGRYTLEADPISKVDGEYFMSAGEVAYVTVQDTVTGGRVWLNQDFTLALVDHGGAITEIEPGIYRAEKYGTAEIVLQFGGQEIDRLKVHCTHLEVGGLFSGGKTTVTSVVKLDDMQQIDWKTRVMSINNRVILESFEATKCNDVYEVIFNAYNSSPMAFGVYSYDKYGNVVNRQFIGGLWYSNSMLDAAWDFLETTGKLVFFQRDTLMTAGDQKTKIKLTVPEGGSIRFLTAKDDEYVQAYNALLLAAGVITSFTDIGSGLNTAINGSSQGAILEGLLELNSSIHFGKLFSDIAQNSFAKNLASELDENTVSEIQRIFIEVSGKASLNDLEDAALDYMTLGASEKIDAVFSLLGDMGCLELMRRDLHAAYGDKPIVWPQYILFPE